MSLTARGLTTRIDAWLRLSPNGTVSARTGKVEIGQGIRTALAQIVADELDVAIERVDVAPVDTDTSPDEGTTAGSRSVETSGAMLRAAAAQTRRALLARASSRLGADPASLAVEDGVVRGPGGTSVSYWDLIDGTLLEGDLVEAPPKPPAERRVVGRSVPRIDLAGKVSGRPAYVQDLSLPGMLHGRVVRPATQAATLAGIDEAAVRAMPGVVALVRDGSFVGIVAEGEHEAIRALECARRVSLWEEPATLPDADPRYLLAEATEDHVALDRGGDAPPPPSPARTLAAEYSRAFIAHGALAPSCAVARLDGDRLTVWTHSQNVYSLRAEMAKVLGIAAADVRAIHVEGAGCYGHNGADDAALDAALLARAVPGRPVRVQWMRDDEFAWEPYGAPAVVRLAATLAEDGRIASWTHEIWGYGHGSRPARARDDVASLLAARHLARPYRAAQSPPPRSLASGALRNAEPLYDLPRVRVVDHHVARSPLRVSALRSLGAHANVFAIESFMDELAARVGSDPLAFRLAHLRDERARAVLLSAVERAGWAGRPRGSGERGMGMGVARYKNAAAYFACVAEVRLERDIGVTRVWGTVDAGMAVNPDGIRNQAEGGIVQAIGWTLRERVRHDRTRILSLGWETYPPLRFSDVPDVAVEVIDRPEEPPLGVGEAFAGPVTAAVANALYDASGIRLRDLPLTRERLIAAAG